MSLQRGFVESIETRKDGWVEIVLLALHSGNARKTYFIPSLDGDLTKAHRRLAQLSVLRDALARSAPVEVEFLTDEKQGDLVEDVTIYTASSLEKRQGVWWTEGIVVSLSILEHGPQSSSTPYLDTPDTASVVLLREAGILESYKLDLQRPEPRTAHAILSTLRDALKTRRPVAVRVAPHESNREEDNYIVGARKRVPSATELEEVVAFVESIGQRSESYVEDNSRLLNHLWVKYTTAPDQYSAGGLSENGSFVPSSGVAWVHQDSPLLAGLRAALRDQLQVRLSLSGDVIHQLEIIAGLGSVARPIWIQFLGSGMCESDDQLCTNQPTTSSPSHGILDTIPHSVSLKGEAYFGAGIWRFHTRSTSPFVLLVDGREVGCGGATEMREATGEQDDRLDMVKAEMTRLQRQVAMANQREGFGQIGHLYLHGVHHVEYRVLGRTCNSRFASEIFRIR